MMTVFYVVTSPEPEGTCQVKASHNFAAVKVTFDDDHVLPNAALVAPALLAQRLGLGELLTDRVHLDGAGAANVDAKALTVLATMLTGRSTIEGCEVLRAGAAPELFDDTRAPSTIGTFLRDFDWAGVRQLDAVSRETLARAWKRRLGPPRLAGTITIDLDSTICEAYGTQKQGCTFGYTKKRGYHPLLATLPETGEVVHSRMRGGNAGAARGAGSFLAETISRVRGAGATGELTVRADSAFYSKAMLWGARKAKVRFSVTVRMNKSIRRAIDAIGESAWRPIPYWLEGGADVAEVDYTCFSGRKKMDVRLIVRRVRPTPGSQLALDVVFSYHALVTDRAGSTLTLEADHRAHANVELVIRDLKACGLAHLPSGKFTANAAWLGLAVMAHNLGRWMLAAAGDGYRTATVATLTRELIAMPARLVWSARQWRLRAPTGWPWARALTRMLTTIAAIPAPT